MRMILLTFAALCALASPAFAQDDAPGDLSGPKWSIAIHGGAGTMSPERMDAETRAAYEAALQAALDVGAAVLADGGSAIDAVVAAITLMEDDPKFNAGRGAVFTWDGVNEHDASIMDGRTRDAGASTGTRNVRHPILLARAVMEDSPHVFLSREGAEQFAAEQGLELVDPAWFGTDARRQALERYRTVQNGAEPVSQLDIDTKFGTVGAVARDTQGNMSAGTSTGGMTGKRWGRIGDAPVIGAGTYADNRACAVSATGWGEYFIRVGVAHEICTRIRIAQDGGAIDCPAEIDRDTRTWDQDQDLAAERGVVMVQCRAVTPLSLSQAQDIADDVMAEVKNLGGDGGVIFATSIGLAGFSFNTTGMYRGRADSTGLDEVAIFAGEDD